MMKHPTSLEEAGKGCAVNKIFRFSLLLFLLCCLAAVLPALGNKEKEPKETEPVVQITGRVRLVGTGTFPELVISGEEKEWYVAGDERQKLMDLQHRIVTVEANETVRELKFAGGQSAGERRTLKNIRIISVEAE